MKIDKPGEFLFWKRRSLDYTAQEVAERIGVSQSWLSRVEHGMGVTDKPFQKICKIYRLTEEEKAGLIDVYIGKYKRRKYGI